jgi:hypothetical protein
MSEETWFVAVDGQQVQGARTTEEVRSLMQESPSKKFMVWKEGMAGWADPLTLPAFKPAPAPPAAAAPTASRAAEAPARAQSPMAAKIAAHAPEARDTVRREAQFLKGLLDFKFEQLITPKIIRTLYLLTMILVGLGFVVMVISALFMIVSGARFGGSTVIIGILYLVLSPVAAIVQLTFARVFFELVLVLFRIKDAIVHMDERASG